ncbi:hypothetical protein ACQR53_15265 [Xanthomonas oryzae]|uniref:hypothetical protein n=1 Tax=Xanthomonas oryzae TaxID=347 RepID=UPI003D1835C7
MRKLFIVVTLAGLALGASSASVAKSACTVCTSTRYDLGWLGTWYFDTGCHSVPSCFNHF